MKNHTIKIDRERCIGCGLCKRTCVAHNIEVTNGKARLNLDRCIACGHCLAVCPKEAISITGFTEEPVPQTGSVRLNPDQVLDVIRFRRSVRKFQDKKISREILGQILEAGRLTHTAKNMQDVSYVVLDKKKDLFEQMAVSLFRRLKPIVGLFNATAKHMKINDHFFFFHAPAVIVILAEDKTNGILASQNMEFVAEAHGLGVLYSGFFTICANISPKIRKALQIPKGKKAAATLVLGYPGEKFLRSIPHETAEIRYM